MGSNISESIVTARYIRYRAKRMEIKKRHRVELEKELTNEALSLGEAFIAQRALGKRIEDIGYMIGLKNRTFIYKMIDLYNKAQAEEEKHSEYEPEPVEVEEKPEKVDAEYEINYSGNTAVVTVYREEDATQHIVETFQGIIEMPEEWITEPDRTQRKLYAKIIKEIEEHAKEDVTG